ncbi:hypothetical protein ABE493_10740, partial [Stenotrophomonas terrae]|uniref:hypothetical protein n=1 Tax=Stenotrophomonas terrae TaxID=405446 RepID=UPI00320A09F5
CSAGALPRRPLAEHGSALHVGFIGKTSAEHGSALQLKKTRVLPGFFLFQHNSNNTAMRSCP